jgi:hypothetical protein
MLWIYLTFNFDLGLKRGWIFLNKTELWSSFYFLNPLVKITFKKLA